MNKRTKKILILLVFIVIVIVFGFYKLLNKNKNTTTYQTQTATKGVLITSVSASGKIANSNIANITTSLSGLVKIMFVKDGDTVVQGQKIAEIELDENGKQAKLSAYAKYLSAQNSLNSAVNSKESARMQVEKDETSIISAKNSLADGADNDLEKRILERNLDQAEATYDLSVKKHSESQNSVTVAQIQLATAWTDYQQASSVVYAPTSGVIKSLFVSEGSYLNLSETTTSGTTTTTKTKIGLIKISSAKILASVSLSEIDVPKIASGQKATILLDAFPDKSFTGKVLSIDVTGSTSGGVTSYPATINFDETSENIYPNMGVTAEIITKVYDSAILVPSSSIKSGANGSFVEVLSNNTPQQVVVTVGDSNNTQIQILSGLNEGDAVITGSSISLSTTSKTATSPFGNTRGVFNMSGGR